MKHWAIVLCLWSTPAGAGEWNLARLETLVADTQKLLGRPLLFGPRIVMLPEPAFSRMACFEAPEDCRVMGMTFPFGLVVLNASKCDYETPACQSVVVHELVHVAQHYGRGVERCIVDEHEAYTVAAQWGKNNNILMNIPAEVTLRLSCERG